MKGVHWSQYHKIEQLSTLLNLVFEFCFVKFFCEKLINFGLKSLWELWHKKNIMEHSEPLLMSCVWLFVTCKDYWRRLDKSLPGPFFFFSLSVDQNFTLLGQGLVHSGSASWGDLGWVFSDGWCVSLFPWWVPILYMESTVSPLLLHWTSYKAASLIHLRSQAMLNWSLQSRGWGLQSLSVLLPIPTASPEALLPLARCVSVLENMFWCLDANAKEALVGVWQV